MKDFFKRCKEQARGALFPAHYTCEICRKEVFDGASFCPACERALPRNDGFICKKCGRRILEDFPVCLECKRELPVYTAARSAFVYGGEIVGSSAVSKRARNISPARLPAKRNPCFARNMIFPTLS